MLSGYSRTKCYFHLLSHRSYQKLEQVMINKEKTQPKNGIVEDQPPSPPSYHKINK